MSGGAGNDDLSSRVLAQGLGRCIDCGKYVPARLVFEDGFTYILKECPFDKTKTKELWFKGKWRGNPWKRIPAYWPHKEAHSDRNLHWEQSDHKLLILSIKLGTECSARCRICTLASRRINKGPSVRFDPAVAERMIAAHRGKIVSFCMVEPTESEYLPGLIRFASRRKFVTVISSNGLKLADRAYLKVLKDAGLDYLFLSFDGFDEELCEVLRGGRHQYHLKLKALENLKAEKMKVGIKAVMVKGLNEKQAGPLLDYALKNDFISEMSFQSLSLGGAEEGGGFDKNSLLSVEEMKELVNGALGISGEYFEYWDELKINLAAVLAKLPFIRVPPFELDTIYFLRRKGGAVPLLDIKALERMVRLLRDGRVSGVPAACFHFLRPLAGFIFKEMIIARRSLETNDSVLRVKIRSFAGTRFFSYTGMTVRRKAMFRP